MDKKEILENILKKGFQITPQALDLINGEEELNKLTNYLKVLCDPPSTISEETARDALGFGLEAVEQFIGRPAGSRVTTADIINYNNKRYEILKKILIEGTPESPLSINKLSKLAPKEQKFSLIAMVESVDRDKKTVLVEDTTGELELGVPEGILEDILEDDVLLFECTKNDGDMRAVGVKWPDIPLKREVNKACEDAKCAFFGFGEGATQQLHQRIAELLGNQGGDLHVFVFDDFHANADTEEKITGLVRQMQDCKIKKIVLVTDRRLKTLGGAVCLKPPAIACIHGIRVLAGGGEMEKYKALFDEDAGESLMLRMLKRRDLNPAVISNEAAGGGFIGAGFVIENTPDFFVSSSAGAPGSANYKGTTIISTGAAGGGQTQVGALWVADLRTRVVNKFNL